MQGNSGVDQHVKETDSAPSLIGRLLGRSGAMTFKRATDGTARVGAPNPRLMRVAEMVSRYSGCGNVLDVGCWTGGLAVALADMARCSYTGVDIETAARAVATARTTMPGHRFMVVSSVEALPFDAASFDVVVLTEVIEHVPAGREPPLLTELARVLRPGGCIILSTPYNNVLNFLDPAWFFGHRHYSVGRLAALARQSGLTMTDVGFSGGIWTTLDTNLLYFFKHMLHRPYGGYHWLHRRTEREYAQSSRRLLATTLWCRLIHVSHF